MSFVLRRNFKRFYHSKLPEYKNKVPEASQKFAQFELQVENFLFIFYWRQTNHLRTCDWLRIEILKTNALCNNY